MSGITEVLTSKFEDVSFNKQETKDGITTLWIPGDQLNNILGFLKNKVDRPYKMLYDLTAIDERSRKKLNGHGTFTVVYHLLSFDRNEDLRLKVKLIGEYPEIPTITGIWKNANWYEREVYDMFGITFKGHPDLRRLLMPESWKGHPLRKEHPARATEMEPFTLSDETYEAKQDELQFNPEQYGFKTSSDDAEFAFLNLGPQHPGTHGILRLVLQLDGEDIVDIAPDIGFHHRGAEKMGERQTWHTYIPYTDRIDYLAGVQNNLPYLLAVEKLAEIEVPERVKYIRVMMCELFRLASHLVWYGTFAQDLGMMSPVFYMFTDREKIFEIVEAICGARMHPNWFRIGGVANDLPRGWEEKINFFLKYFPRRLKEYDQLVMKNRFFKDRTVGIGIYSREEAIEWGVTGPGLRATGEDWDFRKKRPYSGYEMFDFDIPTAQNGDAYDRARVRIDEMWQSLRIIEQCVKNMPSGFHKADHPLAVPPRKDRTMHDIETLITHFLSVSWGPVMPRGEAFQGIEAPKGNNGYYLVSDGNTHSYRTRIRTPSFPHMQMVPYISRGYTVSDVLSILGSIDFVLADLDR
ncbi:MAG TPA: NADH-quinone oxidoreductase subunit C/D [Cryomorphaceae bacterium]|nr:NADH-quinone oxidoreductase subunit C/D [Cryomorphaceae bacterium]